MPALQAESEANLKRPLAELDVGEGTQLLVNDDSLVKPLQICLKFNAT